MELNNILKYMPALNSIKRLHKKKKKNKKITKKDYLNVFSSASSSLGVPLDVSSEDRFVGSIQNIGKKYNISPEQLESAVSAAREYVSGKDSLDLKGIPNLLSQLGIPNVSEYAAVASLIIDDDDDEEDVENDNVDTEGSASSGGDKESSKSSRAKSTTRVHSSHRKSKKE